MAVLTLLLASAPLAALAAPLLQTSPLQPWNVRSPSASLVLEVDPSERYGAGPGQHRVLAGEQVAWSAQLPFTLRGGLIDDLGRIAGYGYQGGWNGTAPTGEFFIAVLSPEGHVRERHAWPMSGGWGPHSPPEPRVSGLLHDERRGRVVVRMVDRDRFRDWEEWRIFDLESGALIDAFRPAERCGTVKLDRASILDARVLTDTGLVALAWKCSFDAASSSADDLKLSIVQFDGSQLASAAFPGGYDVAWGTPYGKRARAHRWSTGLLGQAPRSDEIPIWLPGSKERARFELVQVGEGTARALQELGREAFEPTEATHATKPVVEVEALELALLSDVELDVRRPSDEDARTRIVALGFDGIGRFEVVRQRRGPPSVHTVVLIDDVGNVLRERVVEGIPEQWSESPRWWPLGNGRWLISAAEYGAPRRSDAWMLPASSSRVESGLCSGFQEIEAVAQAPGGGFAVLGNRFWDGGVCVAMYASDGSLRWQLDQDRDGPSAADFATSRDLAVDAQERVAVVDPSGDKLRIVSSEGELLRTILLAETWGRDPKYVSNIARDGDSGYLVVDNTPIRTLVRIDLEGHVRSTLRPRLPGRGLQRQLAGRTQRGPDGRLWTFDDHAVHRLTDEGEADLSLGRQPSLDTLNLPFAARFDPLGRIVILDRETNVLHVHDVGGGHLFYARPQADDFIGSPWEGVLACGPRGRLYVSTHAHAQGWLAFDAEGRRIGPADLGGAQKYGRYKVEFGSDPELHWVQRMQDRQTVLLRDSTGGGVTTLERRADRRRFRWIVDFAASPAGDLAVLESSAYDEGGRTTCTFDRRGLPRGQIDLPSGFEPHAVVHGGTWIVHQSYEDARMLLVRTEDSTMVWFQPPDAWSSARGDTVGFSPQGNELWLLSLEGLRIWRFALP